jgi:NCS1 family nucleobase:cation symporter-1
LDANALFSPMASIQATPSPEFDEFKAHPSLTNNDLKPTTPLSMSFSWLEMARLWIGLVVGVPSYYLVGAWW